MFAVSHVIILPFHPHLKLNHKIIERSYDHSLEKLTTLNYLTGQQLSSLDKATLLKLKDCVLAVSKIAISSIFSTDLKFASDCLLK